MLDTLTVASFEPHVGSSFQIRPGGADALTLKLIEASAAGGDPSPKREPFSLVFVGPDEPLLEQAIYPVEHDELGQLTLFMVPLGPHKDGGLRYEVVFT